MTDQQPSVGRIVHYVSYGTPGGEYTSQCRAAVIAGIAEGGDCDLVVLNPTGLFFNRCAQDEGDVYVAGVERRPYRGGTWHWPERV
jgi:hypothetical protein